MAKKKKNSKASQQTNMSPERFMREKARTLPIGKCYITPRWQQAGISIIIISRVRPSGNLSVGVFLVDTFCIGVKDATYHANMSESDFEDLKERYESGPGLEEISYNEAHNIIYGAIGFAEDGGIQPARDFGIARYILEEDTDDIPLIEYEFGKNGKHFLIIKSDRREMPYFCQLKKTLGDDFEYVMDYTEDLMSDDWDYDEDSMEEGLPTDAVKETMDNWRKMMAESNLHPE